MEQKKLSVIRIRKTKLLLEREPFLQPFRFKGGALTGCWQVAVYLESEAGSIGIGLGTQSILWSDARVFAAHSEEEGNKLMFRLTKKALQLLEGKSFTEPINLIDELLPGVLAFGKEITGNPDLRKTFALNALVGVDQALWMLYAQENDISSYDEMISESYRPGLSYQHSMVASISTFNATSGMDAIKNALEQGYFMLKLKIGSKGDQQEMLEQDLTFLRKIHASIGHFETPYTRNGRIPYYFDANGRYENKETLLQFLDEAERIGALDQIALIEEPFDEKMDVEVGDLGVRIAADESAHTLEDARIKVQQGYTAFALKAVAKTLSMTLKIAQLAYEERIPLCFCADLTVNPILVDWNKCVAARLAPFPGMDIGMLESNGHQYYRNWDRMQSYHPAAGAEWTKIQKGVYLTNETFFQESGGVLQPPNHYKTLFADRLSG